MYYTKKEMAEVLKVSPQTVYRWGVSGKLETVQPFGKGGRILYKFKEEGAKNEQV